jgi:hypothetical protein
MLPVGEIDVNAARKGDTALFIGKEKSCVPFSRSALPSSGQGAPASIHFSTTAIWSPGRSVPGGISIPLSCLSALTSRLLAGSPGTIAGPLSPPCMSAARESSRSPDSDLSSPWHFTHFSSKSGRICPSKSLSLPVDAASAASR